MDPQPPRGIYKRGDIYWCRARVGGELKRRPAGRTLEEAKEVLAGLRAEQEAARARSGGRTRRPSRSDEPRARSPEHTGRPEHTGAEHADFDEHASVEYDNVDEQAVDEHTGGEHADVDEHAFDEHDDVNEGDAEEHSERDERIAFGEDADGEEFLDDEAHTDYDEHADEDERIDCDEFEDEEHFTDEGHVDDEDEHFEDDEHIDGPIGPDEHTDPDQPIDPDEHIGRGGRARRSSTLRSVNGEGSVHRAEPEAPVYEARYDAGDDDPTVLRVRDLYRVWAELPRGEPLRRTTMKGTRLALNRFAGWAGPDRPAAEITEKMVQAYANERRQHVSTVSVQSELRPLSAALNAAVESGYLEERPRIKLAKSKRRRPTFLEKEEVLALLEVAPDEGSNAELAIRIALGSGLRHQEVLHLRGCDCRLGEHPSVVVAAWGGWAPKSGIDREVPISRDLADRIAARIRHLPDQRRTAPLFQHPDGRRVCSVARPVAAAFRCAGLYRPETRPGLHCLRRTWATHLLRTGTDVETVRVLGGWADLKTPMHYLGSSARHQRAAIERLPW